ncbi:MAG: class I SAM-dependent methyltransferase, partial [Verrucomicrobia bacterium]|nr:class I SAM-dependent methyltransferase [Verrucomicrobiota bacterium]
LLQGQYRWHALDRIGIPGFGSDLLRLDFPPRIAVSPRWGFGRPVHDALARLIDADQPAQLALLRSCLGYAADVRAWPEREDRSQPALPWRDNPYLTRPDAAVLYGMLRQLAPDRFLEIGAGMSTRIAWQARRAGNLAMAMIAIDPEPRLEVTSLCDRLERRYLEDRVEEFLPLVTPRSVVFFDGSHRCFPASDVTVFFLELLPRFPPGTVIHVHDVYLPNDYPPTALNRCWSEQYLLAAWLLGGAAGLEILLPCARLAQLAEPREWIAAAVGGDPNAGSSFWLRKT